MSSMKLPPPKRTEDVIEIPIPPSTNNLFASAPGGGHRFKSSEYKAWIADTERAFLSLKVQTAYPVEIEVVVFGEVNRGRDLDNVLKPIGDQLKAAGVVRNDNLKHVGRWDVRYEPGHDGPPMARVIVWPPEKESSE